MPDTRYAFISAYLKGEEAGILTSDHVDRMSRASSFQDALAAINDTDVGYYLNGIPIRTFNDLDESLWRYLGGCVAHIEAFKFLPEDIRKILKAYVVKYDVFNIKAALQGIVTRKRAGMIPIGLIHDHGLTDELSKDDSIGGIGKILTHCKLGSYARVLGEYKKDEGLKSRLLTEARLDNEYYRSLLNAVRGVKDGPVLVRTIGIIIDLINLQLVGRAIIEGTVAEAADYIISGGYTLSVEAAGELLSIKLTDMPGRLENTMYHGMIEEVSNSYAKTRNINSVAELVDRYRFILLKELLAIRLFSPLTAVWYLVLKELEIRDLRLMLKAILDRRPLGTIVMSWRFRHDIH